VGERGRGGRGGLDGRPCGPFPGDDFRGAIRIVLAAPA